MDDAGNESEAAAIMATTNGSETQTVDPGMIADYKKTGMSESTALPKNINNSSTEQP